MICVDFALKIDMDKLRWQKGGDITEECLPKKRARVRNEVGVGRNKNMSVDIDGVPSLLDRGEE